MALLHLSCMEKPTVVVTLRESTEMFGTTRKTNPRLSVVVAFILDSLQSGLRQLVQTYSISSSVFMISVQE